MNLITVEDDIVSRLNTISGIKAVSWPDAPGDYPKIFKNGVLLVRYNGSNYENPEPNNQPKVVQERTLEWQIAILSKSFKETKKHQGAYTLIESVRAKLTGYTPTGFSDASIMYPLNDGFLTEEAGFHVYTANYAFTFPEAEA